MQSDVFKVGTDATLLGAFIDPDLSASILDIGTGTGVIPLMLAQRFPSAEITGMDNNPQSVTLAERNFNNSPFSDRLTSVLASADTFNPERKYDCIVTNPPYHHETTKPSQLHMAQAKHLDALPIAHLVNCLDVNLSEYGSFYVIATPTYIDQLTFALMSIGLKPMLKMSFQHNAGMRVSRVIAGYSRREISLRTHDYALYTTGRIFTPEVKERLAPFLLKL